MPPRIRTRATKALKENIDTENTRPKVIKKVKSVRKVLGDKTNSLSDDNESVEIPIKKVNKVATTSERHVEKTDVELNKVRPRRQRRLPNRYVENPILNNLSNSKDQNDVVTLKATKKIQDDITQHAKKSSPECNHKVPHLKKSDEVKRNLKSKENDVPIKTGNKKTPVTSKPEVNGALCVDTPSPFKTPVKNVDSSIVIDRPRRICRLPSRFEDHSVSPSKFIPVQPCYASTPIVPNKSKTSDTTQSRVKNDTNTYQKNTKTNDNVAKNFKKTIDTQLSKEVVVETTKSSKTITQKKIDDYVNKKISPDNNNNPKRPIRNKRLLNERSSPVLSTTTTKIFGNKILNKSNSFKVLEDKRENKNIDVYEFTFDPNEEPTPKKKKRKRVVNKKKPIQTKKQYVYTNNYDKNVSKALAALKSVVSKKPVKSQALEAGNKQSNDKVQKLQNYMNKIQNVQDVPEPSKPSLTEAVNTSLVQIHSPVYEVDEDFNHSGTTQIHSPVYEDDADIHHSGIDLNYSPTHPINDPVANDVRKDQPQEQVNKDPLNLQDDLSFFDDAPVASSSVNVSMRHPFASPWRVEFESLPIKWHVNSYVKSNMTPAVESSFISSEDNTKKKHVYTNMVPLNNDSLPQIVDTQPNLMQTSMVSFIKEVAEKQARKKLHKSPRKVNSLFEDITNTTNYDIYTPKKLGKNTSSDRSSKNTSTVTNVSNDKENSKESRKRKNNDEISSLPAKSPRTQKEKDCTYFGFDDTEDHNENDAPVRNKNHIRSLRPRGRAVLNEINQETGSTRPVAAKSNMLLSSLAVNKVYEDLKSAADAPIFKEQNVNNIETTNIDESQLAGNDDESQSVHLFEDIDVVHHLKPTRKSYGKAKKVVFRPKSVSDSDTQSDIGPDVEHEFSEEDDLFDLSFHIPKVVEKKTKKKKSVKKKFMSKKEEKEAEAWAAGFNSMCEDIEEFPLVVE